ncbi:MAG TPA: N-acetylneuraminate synthase family protein [Afipia sp.]
MGEQIIKAAASTGANAVKFQNYRTEDFLSDKTLTYRYVVDGHSKEQSQFDLFKQCEMSYEDLVAYRKTAEYFGLDFISTPTSMRGVDDLVSIDAAAIKNGSDFLGNLPLLKHMANSGLPTIVSTGMATAEEIDEAVGCFPGQKPILLHCISMYPAPMSELNLLKIPTLASATGCLTGYSDHSLGSQSAALATALGACVIEKHFTLDHALPGPDHSMSTTPQEMAELVRSIREAEMALGSSQLAPAAGEAHSRDQYRLSCVADRNLSAGTVVAENDIVYHRPGGGIKPAEAGSLVGRKLGHAVDRGHLFKWSDFQ